MFLPSLLAAGEFPLISVSIEFPNEQ
jgi:hypothetical protein